MKIISDVYIVSALHLFTLNKDEYLKLEDNLDVAKADLTKPVFINSSGKIIEGWETLKYVLDSNSFINLYYQVIE
jgi:hypothetical protein